MKSTRKHAVIKKRTPVPVAEKPVLTGSRSSTIIMDDVALPPPSLNQRADVLINGDRQQDYGDKLQNFAQTAMIWQGLLAHKLLPGAKILPEDVGHLMIGLKLSRLAKTPDHNDSLLDIAGYAGCVDKLQSERIAEKGLLGATEDYGSFIAKSYNAPE